jgi:Na+-driven multidrug efflux pump
MPAATLSHGSAVAGPDGLAPRTRRILTAPLVPTLLRLAAPTILLMLVLAAMTAIDAFYVGWLGSDALAGVALVFPMMMLMTAMSAAGLGGGITSAVARALGRRQTAEADLLASHALVISAAFAERLHEVLRGDSSREAVEQTMRT